MQFDELKLNFSEAERHLLTEQTLKNGRNFFVVKDHSRKLVDVDAGNVVSVLVHLHDQNVLSSQIIVNIFQSG